MKRSQNPHGITLIEAVLSVGCIATSLAMLRAAVLLADRLSEASHGPLPGALTLGASFLIGAVIGNATAVTLAGREHAVDGVLLGGTLLTMPLTLACLQFL